MVIYEFLLQQSPLSGFEEWGSMRMDYPNAESSTLKRDALQRSISITPFGAVLILLSLVGLHPTLTYPTPPGLSLGREMQMIKKNLIYELKYHSLRSAEV